MPFYLDSGFFFADFRGDHVTTATGKVFLPNEVKLWCNCLTLPPNCQGRIG